MEERAKIDIDPMCGSPSNFSAFQLFVVAPMTTTLPTSCLEPILWQNNNTSSY